MFNRRLTALLAAAAVGGLAAPGRSESTYRFEISNHVDMAHPTCTVEVWAEFDPELFAFAGADFDVFATQDVGAFSSPQRVLNGPGTSDGIPSLGGDSVVMIVAGQIKQLPKEPHLEFGNPVLIWRGTWSTLDFTPRVVDLRTQTRRFEVYVSDKFKSVSYVPFLEEGAGQIRVGGCFADCNGDGITDIFDFLCFTNEFNIQSPDADCDGNGLFDLFDFMCFVNVFVEGC